MKILVQRSSQSNRMYPKAPFPPVKAQQARGDRFYAALGTRIDVIDFNAERLIFNRPVYTMPEEIENEDLFTRSTKLSGKRGFSKTLIELKKIRK